MQFLHKHITQPALTDGNAITKAARDLSLALRGKRNILGDKQEYNLNQLSTLLQEVADISNSQVTDEESHPDMRVSAPRVPSPRVHTNPAGLEELENKTAPPIPAKREWVRVPSRAVQEAQALDVETEIDNKPPA